MGFQSEKGDPSTCHAYSTVSKLLATPRFKTPNLRAAHFKRMQECPSVKKPLAYKKEVNEKFAKTAQEIIKLRLHAQLSRSKDQTP
jgi:hypothetical protein